MRFLALDVGDRRIGVAAGDDGFKTAFPKSTIVRTGDASDVELVAQACRAYEADHVVVGIPLDSEGHETPRSRNIRRFMGRVRKLTGLPVAFWNEALSTRKAEQLMVGADATRSARAASGDSVAASIILQEYLDAT